MKCAILAYSVSLFISIATLIVISIFFNMSEHPLCQKKIEQNERTILELSKKADYAISKLHDMDIKIDHLHKNPQSWESQ